MTGFAMAVFNPFHDVGLHRAVVLMLALFVRHVTRSPRMLRDDDAPGHDELRRTLNSVRETRGV